MDRVIVVGGGASGVVAAIFAKREDNEVIILEKNKECLKKILVTGNGKCNYLNELYNKKFYNSENMEFIDEIITSKNILKVKDFFDDLGIVSKIKNGYYYPFSNQAVTIKNALIKRAIDLGVKIINNVEVKEISKDKDLFKVVTSEKNYTCSKLVIATGSYAMPKSGSTGDGYKFMESFGIEIVPVVPALVQLIGDFKYQKEWTGIRSDVRLSLFEDDKFILEEEGEIQLTDYGISGICTFNLSQVVSRGLFNGKKEVIKINFLPFVEDLVTNWLIDYSLKHKGYTIRELLEGILNYKLVEILLKYNKINPNKDFFSLTKEEKYSLIKSLRGLEIKITGTKGFDSCQVCNGGVKLTEINPKTMECLKVKGLYVTGELLDITGNCGGYNLTNCWISGMLAGMSIGEVND